MRAKVVWGIGLLAIFGFVLGTFGHKRIPSFAGRYDIRVRYVHNQTEEYNSTGKIWGKFYVTSPKPRQKQYVWGTYFAAAEITNQMKAEVRISLWANNNWKRNAFVMNFPHMCSDVLKHAKFFVEIGYGPTVNSCPFPKVYRHDVSNRTLDANFPYFPVMPYGRYLFTMAFALNVEIVGVPVADVDIVPKV